MTDGNQFRIEIFAVQEGQAIDTQLDYYVDSGTMPASEILTAFRALWRTPVLAALSETYQVNKYSIKRLAGIFPMFPLGPTAFPNPNPLSNPTPSPRWDEAFELAGVTTTDAGQDDADPMPSYACATTKKVCAAFEAPDMITALPLEKKPRGNFSYPALLEEMTEPTNGNIFTAAANTLFAAFNTALLNFTSTNGAYKQCVLSFVKDKMYRYTVDTVPVPDEYTSTYAVAQVTSLITSPYVSTRVSRKQTVSNLG